MLGVHGFGLILAFFVMTCEDIGPLTQQIGLAFKCKATLIRGPNNITNSTGQNL